MEVLRNEQADIICRRPKLKAETIRAESNERFSPMTFYSQIAINTQTSVFKTHNIMYCFSDRYQ